MPFELGNVSGLTISLRDNGAVEAIRSGGVLINQVLGNDAEGGLGNVYLRRHVSDAVAVAPLLAPGSGSRFGATEREARWDGTFEGIEYRCSLRLDPDALVWFWTLRLANTTHEPIKLDVVLAQDVGLAAEAAVRTSELYTSQYIDHTPIEDPRFGVLLCSRQNLPLEGRAPWVMHGCVEGAAGYLTDAFQLYGLDYRTTDRPAALERPTLPNEVYQYEVALPTLQARPVTLEPGAATEVTFFAAFEPDHPAASGPDDAPRAAEAAAMVAGLPSSDPDLRPAPVATGRFARPSLFEAQDLTDEDLDRYFGTDRRHVEQHDGALLSFFHGDGRHVVLRAKERIVERPTGHILLSGDEPFLMDDRLAVTAWMSGVFGSQLTIGNTSFHKILSVIRNPLNVLKSGGQRIFVRDRAGRELLLGVPSAFEMAPATVRWIYRDSNRTLVVTVATDAVEPTARLTIELERGEPMELVVTHHVVLAEHEGGPGGSIEVDPDRGRVRMRPAAQTLFAQRYPAATVHLVAADPSLVRSIDVEGEHVVVETEAVRRFELAITGSILDEQLAASRAASAFSGGSDAPPSATDASPSAPSIGLHGAAGRMADDVARLSDTLRWYAHDATIHHVSPHGLEQTGGAAWGVRDVCQGPVEFLLATGKSMPVRDIVRTVYEHQYLQTGDWPQWFMFDRYEEIQQADSHGDVIHWPLKALCDYVEVTNDLSILDEELAYTDRDRMTRTTETQPLFEHVERQIERIEQDVIPGTTLPIYGGGDWEDTLQPADPDLAQNLVSAWTTELAYQTLGRFREVCVRAGRGSMADRVGRLVDRLRADFNRYLVPDGVVAGLASFGGDEVEYFLHPRDRKTGVAYRLLPMTRGMISGMFTPEQAATHVELVERHLLFPDGARLMNRPMAYRGGPSRFFKRAESAANFGREIGLQYVHAHIRYVEAMAKLGRAEQAFRGLMTVCPIGIEEDVPSAHRRQSNAYFSSSDAAFRDRHEASREFERLRTGEVGVKGGWRIYSSGPGIYINQVVSNVIGLRRQFDDVVFDPVLPTGADGLTLDLPWDGRSIRFTYHVTAEEGPGVRTVEVNGRTLEARPDASNPYRHGGVRVSATAFAQGLDRVQNQVDIAL